MEALRKLVKAGKARIIGASTMLPGNSPRSRRPRANGWNRFISMQNQVKLIYCEGEREMIALCLDQGVGLLPRSPLARGRPAWPWGTRTVQALTAKYAESLSARTEAADRAVVDTVQAVAAEVGRPMA